MSLRETAVSDFKDILDTDNESVTFTKLSDDSTFTAKVQIVRTTDRYDPQTNTSLEMPVSGLVIPFASMPAWDSIGNRTHKAEFTDATGATYTKFIVSPRPNFSLGFLRVDLEDYNEI
jgi:hypothetical protein